MGESMEKVEKKQEIKKLLQGSIFTLIAIILAVLPPFGNLERPAMIYLGAFVWMLLIMTFQVLPDFITVLVTLLVLILFGVTDFQVAFSQFGGSTVWLVIGVLGLSVAISKSGVLNRIALYLLKPFPETYNFQILALFITNLILAPLIPSNFGKLGILSPLAVSISENYGYKKSSKGAVGIFNALYMSAGIFGNAFMTGAAAVPIMIGFMTVGITNFSFISWLSGTWVWLVVIFIGSYLFIINYYKPDDDHEIVTGVIQKEIDKLPKISKEEIMTLIIMGVAIILWITEGFHGISATLVILFALSAFVITGILTPAEFNTKIDWKTVVFVGGILTISNYVTPLGIGDWISGSLGHIAGPLVNNVYIFVLILCILAFLSRFVIISSISLITIFLAVFGTLAANIGISSFVIVYVVFMVCQDWNTPFNNFSFITTLAITEHKLADYKDTYPMNIAFFILNVIAFLVSIPFWKMAGFIQ